MPRYSATPPTAIGINPNRVGESVKNLNETIALVSDYIKLILDKEDRTQQETQQINRLSSCISGLSVLSDYLALMERSGIVSDRTIPLLDNNILYSFLQHTSGEIHL
jgi:hypothetical protein